MKKKETNQEPVHNAEQKVGRTSNTINWCYLIIQKLAHVHESKKLIETNFFLAQASLAFDATTTSPGNSP